MGTKLPRRLEQKMQIVGEQIKLARLRRNLSVAQIAERATCSPLTVSRIEKGASTVAIGIYLRVLYALQLDDDILLLAKEDVIGKALQDLSLKKRERASKKELIILHDDLVILSKSCQLHNSLEKELYHIQVYSVWSGNLSRIGFIFGLYFDFHS